MTLAAGISTLRKGNNMTKTTKSHYTQSKNQACAIVGACDERQPSGARRTIFAATAQAVLLGLAFAHSP
jgi:hypothetical protein